MACTKSRDVHLKVSHSMGMDSQSLTKLAVENLLKQGLKFRRR